MKVKIAIEIDVPDTGLSKPEVVEAVHEHTMRAAHLYHLEAVLKSLGKPGHEQIVAVHKTWAGLLEDAPFTIECDDYSFTKS